MKGVKSFRIDDLLTDKSSSEKRPNVITSGEKSSPPKSGKESPSGQDDISNFSLSEESSCSSLTLPPKMKLSPSPPPAHVKSTVTGQRAIMPRGELFGGGNAPPSLPFLPSVAHAHAAAAAATAATAGHSHPYGFDVGNKAFPYAFSPYSFESFKLSQPSSHGMPAHGHPVPAHTHPGPFPGMPGYIHGRTEFHTTYHGMFGHFKQVALANGHGQQEKRHFPHERIHYPMYSLSRPLYPTACKRKGGQIRFNNSQTAQLEKAFMQQKYLNAHDRKKLAHSLGLSDRQVKTWFQNRRAKLRKCKGGSCGEAEDSGSPQDLRTVRILQYENGRLENGSDDAKKPK